MPLKNPLADPQIALLSLKLDLLDRMQALIHGMNAQSTENIVEEDARRFHEEMADLVDEASMLDEKLEQIPHPANDGEQELMKAIAQKVEELSETNSNLTLSIKARIEIVGDQLEKLKKGKNLLKTYKPDINTDPSLVDSKL